jgi:hypothetical protein
VVRAYREVILAWGALGDDRDHQLTEVRIEVQGVTGGRDVGAGRIGDARRVGVHRAGERAVPGGLDLAHGR